MLNGALLNAATGQVQAQGTVGGSISNAGQFAVTGALAGGGAGFANGSTGVLVNLGSAYAGIGAISNATSGRIVLGNGTTNASLSGTSMTNAGSIEMMNGRTGDLVQLSGAYSGQAGARITFDINMASNANLSDRLITSGSTGPTTVSLQNIGAARTYFSQPIVLIAGGSTGGFTAATDASTQAALTSNGIVDYRAGAIAGTADWGITSAVNTERASSIVTGAMAFAGLGEIGMRMGAEDLAAGGLAAGQGTGRVWGRLSSASQDVTSSSITSDRFATAGSGRSEMDSEGFRVGGVIRVLARPDAALDVGAFAGQSEGTLVHNVTGLETGFDMPVYGAYAVLAGPLLRADLQYEALDVEIDPSDSVSTSLVNGDGTRMRAGLGAPIAIRHGTVEPYVRAERLSIDLDAGSAAGGAGTLVFDSLQTEMVQAGVRTRITIPGTTWTVTPSLDLSVTQEDGSGATRFNPTGGASSGSARRLTQADAAISVIHNTTGLELFAQATGRSGDDADGMAVVLGARYRF